MNALLTAPTAARNPQTNPLLERAAFQLDSRGQIRRALINQENHFAGPDSNRLSTRHFTDSLDVCQRQDIAAMYQEGVRAGRLYQFIDTQVDTDAGPQAVTLLLYFHESTQQGWLFVEPAGVLGGQRELSMAA